MQVCVHAYVDLGMVVSIVIALADAEAQTHASSTFHDKPSIRKPTVTVKLATACQQAAYLKPTLRCVLQTLHCLGGNFSLIELQLYDLESTTPTQVSWRTYVAGQCMIWQSRITSSLLGRITTWQPPSGCCCAQSTASLR